MSFDTPEGRYAATQSLGVAEYNRQYAAHVRSSFLAIVNGYGLRPLNTRFGRLIQVYGEGSDGKAFATLEQAHNHANSLPTGKL